MSDINKIVTYSMLGIVAVFFVISLGIEPTITGDASLRDKFKGIMGIMGDCTSAKETCLAGAFCNAKLMQSPGTKLKGVYKGYCINKYPSGHLCKRGFQCRSGVCAGVDEGLRGKFVAPQIGACV